MQEGGNTKLYECFLTSHIDLQKKIALFKRMFYAEAEGITKHHFHPNIQINNVYEE